jgi:hypothetical protein
MDGASAQGKSAQYGINWASHVPQEARQADRRCAPPAGATSTDPLPFGLHLPLPLCPICPLPSAYSLCVPACSDFAEQTRKRLEEAAKKKEAEEREKAALRYQRKDYRTGRLTGGCGVRVRLLADMLAGGRPGVLSDGCLAAAPPADPHKFSLQPIAFNSIYH